MLKENVGEKREASYCNHAEAEPADSYGRYVEPNALPQWYKLLPVPLGSLTKPLTYFSQQVHGNLAAVPPYLIAFRDSTSTVV
jgi:hypothetical protein